MSKKKKIIIVTVGVVILLCCAVAVFLFIRAQRDCPLTNVSLGMSYDEVTKKLKNFDYEESSDELLHNIYYKIQLLKIDGYLIYKFDKDELVELKWSKNISSEEELDGDVEKLYTWLKKKYGQSKQIDKFKFLNIDMYEWKKDDLIINLQYPSESENLTTIGIQWIKK